jgi:hypothetical protein
VTALDSGHGVSVNEHALGESMQGRSELELCPGCHAQVYADAYAVHRQGRWYHLRCARHADGRDGHVRLHAA